MEENKSKVQSIITYGTFDMFHIGHLRLLQRLKSMSETLIVAVSTDEFNKIKGKSTLIPYAQRVEIVKNISCVDIVIAENSWDQKVEDIKKYNIDIFAIGDDWEGKFNFLNQHCTVLYLPRTTDISTTHIKKRLASFLSSPNTEIPDAIKIIKTLKKDFE